MLNIKITKNMLAEHIIVKAVRLLAIDKSTFVLDIFLIVLIFVKKNRSKFYTKNSSIISLLNFA